MNLKKFLIVVFAICFFTFFRSYLVLLSPILLFIIAYLFNVKLTLISLFSILTLIATFVIQTLFNNLYLLNFITSMLLCYLGVFIFLLKAKKSFFSLNEWMNISSLVLIIVNVSALINFFYVLITKNGLLDDGFNGIYGRSGLSMHTLCIVNFIYAVYYLVAKRHVRFAIFFLSGFLCFYGLGLLMFISVLGFLLVKNLNKEYWKYAFFAPLVLVIIFFFATQVNPTIVSYIGKNLDRAVSSLTKDYPYENEMKMVEKLETVKTPRKILMFKGVFKLWKEKPSLIFIGTGPGTYNSRTSFLLNGEYTRNPIFKKVKVEPYYAKRDIYPLWNGKITFQYNDGTRNEPFSSIIALLVEYGLINGVIILFGFLLAYKRALKRNPNIKLFIRFLFLFLLVNLVFENYFEYPEFFVLIIIILKCLETSLPFTEENEKYFIVK